MLDKKEYVQIEVGGKHYLCSIWYRSKDILWYGKRLESEISNLCYAVSREGLLKDKDASAATNK